MDLEQLRAHRAFTIAGELPPAERKAFLGAARRLPEMLRRNGLLASWAFLLAKKGGSDPAPQHILTALKDHLGSQELGGAAALLAQLERVFAPGSPPSGELPTGADLRRLSAEAILFAGWLKRSAEALCDEGEGGTP